MGSVRHENTSFILKWKPPEDASDDSGRCLDEKLAKEVLTKNSLSP